MAGKSSSSSSRAQALWIVIGVVVVGGLAALIAVATAGEQSSGPVDFSNLSAPTVTGDALPQFTDQSNDQAVGKPAPAFSGENFDGDKVSVDPAKDGPMAVMIVAHWCPHCQAEVPRVQQLVDSQGLPDGVQIYTVASSNDPSRGNWPPSAWLEGVGWTQPVVADTDNSIAQAYGLTAFPYFVFIDGQGKVVARTSGEIPMEQLSAQLTSLANGGGAVSESGGAASTVTPTEPAANSSPTG